MTTRERLHDLIDELPAEYIEAAADSLERLCGDPVLRAFVTAPPDDEPLEDDERELLDRRWAAYKAGHSVTMEEVLARFAADRE